MSGDLYHLSVSGTSRYHSGTAVPNSPITDRIASYRLPCFTKILKSYNAEISIHVKNVK